MFPLGMVFHVRHVCSGSFAVHFCGATAIRESVKVCLQQPRCRDLSAAVNDPDLLTQTVSTTVNNINALQHNFGLCTFLAQFVNSRGCMVRYLMCDISYLRFGCMHQHSNTQHAYTREHLRNGPSHRSLVVAFLPQKHLFSPGCICASCGK